jgi:hypothetical protein
MAVCGLLADFCGPRSVVNGRPIDMGRGDKVVTVAATERWKVANRSGNLAQRPRPRRPVQGPPRWRPLSGVATRQGDSMTCTAGDPLPAGNSISVKTVREEGSAGAVGAGGGGPRGSPAKERRAVL